MPRPGEKHNVSAEIVDKLRAEILTGKYAVGEKIPPERDLAAQLGVNRASIREAVKKLEHLGLVRIRQGDGTRVQNFMETGGLELISHLIPLAPTARPDLIRDLLEFRRLQGREIARLAALRAQPDDLAKLDALVTAGAKVASPIEAFELDFDFYVALTQATHNLVFLLLINTVRDAVRAYGPLLTNLMPSLDDVRAHHVAVLERLRAGDASGAAAVADAHLRIGCEQAARLGGPIMAVRDLG